MTKLCFLSTSVGTFSNFLILKQSCLKPVDLRQQSLVDPKFKLRIIIADESCAYSYDSEIKQQSLQLRGPQCLRLKKEPQVRMLWVFFDICGVVHQQFIPHGQIVHALYYDYDALKGLKENTLK